MQILKTRDVKTPTRGTEKSTGIDFFIPNDIDSIHILPRESITIPLGIKIILDDGFDMIFTNKSGIASKTGLIVGACLIDNDYRGELMLNLINTSSETRVIESGQKIIQGVIQKINYLDIQEITEKEFPENTERGNGGFGSTGIY